MLMETLEFLAELQLRDLSHHLRSAVLNALAHLVLLMVLLIQIQS